MLISLPPSELPAASLPGSLFSREALALAALSPELNAALDVLEAECERSGMTPIYVARPEIFAHGAARDWLKSHSGGARDHIGLSDGATVWRAPGFGNYAFFYGREHLAPMRALETLARRAPELLASLDGQINTALSFVGRGTRHCPAPLALSARASTGDADVTLRRLFVRPHAADGGRASMLACAAVARPTAPFAHLTYAPLTEASLACPDFTALLADRLATAAFDPARLWVLRPPTRIGASLDFGMRLQALLLALARGPGRRPGRRSQPSGSARGS